MKIILVTFILFSASVSLNAQTHIAKPVHYSCEENAAHFDGLANMMNGNEERLFVIARLGKGEVSLNYNRRRLYNVRIYFKNWENVPNWNIDAKRFVFAEGESLKTEEARIEFYLSSKLVIVSLVKRNRDICVDCCEFDNGKYYGTGKNR
jgi:hypothetical protein